MTANHIAEFHDLPLQPHPTCQPGPLHSLSVSGALDVTGRITVDCLLQGELVRLRLPEAARAPRRRDELWRHTCFELFARRGAADAYVEFNFSPSGDWAMYHFEGYRRGQGRPELAQPGITLHALGPGQLRLQARAQLPNEVDSTERVAAPGTRTEVWQIGFAAVIEASDGTLAYWATRHPGVRPDFHAPENFSLALVPSGEAPRTRTAMP